MTNLINILNSTGDGFCKFALAMLIQSGILIVLLYLIDLLIRKHVRAVFRYCIWMLIFVKLILPPTLCLPTGIGYWCGLDIWPADKQVIPETPMKVTAQEDHRVTIETPANPAISKNLDAAGNQLRSSEWPRNFTEMAIKPVQQTKDIPPTSTMITWQAVVFLIWLVGLLVLSVLLLQRFLFVKSLLAQSDKANGRLDETLQQCCRQVGIRKNIELRLSKNMLSPAACGLFKPVILMPASLLKNLSKEKLRAVLIHELAHIKRGDLWVNFLQTLLQIVYFYNPLLWFANAVVRGIREKAVDEMVLTKLGDEADSYSNTLIDIAEIAFSRPHFSLRLVGVVESKKALSGRIKHILSRPFPKTAKLGLTGLVAVILTAAILLPMAKAGSGKSNDKFKAALSNGLTVELVGVGLRNAESKTWWQPDGSKLGESIETVDLSSYDSVDPAYEFVFKTSGDGAFKVESIKGSNVIFGVQVPGRADMTGSRGHIKESVRKTNIKIASPSGKWKTIVKSKGGGSVSGKFKGKTVVLAAAEKAGNDVVISSSDQVGYKYATRLIAVDKYGKELAGKIKTDTGVNNIRQRTIRFTDLGLPEIVEFRFQTCPYEYYTFKSVSLKPKAKSKREDIRNPVSLDENSKPIITHTLYMQGQPEKPVYTLENKTHRRVEQVVAHVGELMKQKPFPYIRVHTTSQFQHQQEPIERLTQLCREIGFINMEFKYDLESAANNFTATLPNGVTVELVGISEHATDKWWAPDGSLINNKNWKVDRKSAILPSAYEKKLKEIVAKSSGANDPKILTWKFDNIPGCKGAFDIIPSALDRTDWKCLVEEFSSDQKTATVSLAITYGPFGKQWTGSGTTDYGSYVISKVFVKDGKTAVTVSQDFQGCDFRVRARDNKDQWHTANIIEGSGGPLTQEVYIFENAKPKDIDFVALETRPYKWVTFKNVSLKPNLKTKVQIEVESPAVLSVANDNKQKLIAQRHFVRLVVDEDKDIMTFQGRPADEDTWHKELEKLSDPSHTVLQIAFTPDTAPEQGSMAWVGIAQTMSKIQDEYGLEYISFVGEHPLGSKADPSEVYIRAQLQFNRDIPLGLKSIDELVNCRSIKFVRTQDNQLNASLQLGVTSYPKTKWELRLNLLDSESKEIKTVFHTFENSGVIAGVAVITSQVLEFQLGELAGLENAKKFELRIRQIKPEAQKPAGLVGYWSFDINANDSSSNGNHGTVHGAGLRGGVSKSAYFFNGNDDYVSLPEMHLKGFTFSAWVKAKVPQKRGERPVTIKDGRKITSRESVNKNVYESFDNRRIFFVLDNEQRFYAIQSNNKGGVGFSASTSTGEIDWDIGVNEYDWSFENDLWTHIAVTYDGSTVNIYKNGELTETGEGNFLTELTGTAYIGGTQKLRGEFWHGMIDEVSLYSRALTSNEISGLYNKTAALTQVRIVKPIEQAKDKVNSSHHWKEFVKQTEGETYFVDFDKSTITSHVYGVDLSSEESIQKWARDNGYDALVKFGERPQLIGYDTAYLFVSSNEWDDMSAVYIDELLRQKQLDSAPYHNGQKEYMKYAIRTREGAIGWLRMATIDDQSMIFEFNKLNDENMQSKLAAFRKEQSITKLSFHILPNKDTIGQFSPMLSEEQVAEYRMQLRTNGPSYSTTQKDVYRWLKADRPQCTLPSEAITEEYSGMRYVLVCNWRPRAMLSGPEYPENWHLTNVKAETDSHERPAIRFELDEIGQEQMAMITGQNDHIGRSMAIVLNGKIIAAPKIQSKLSKQGMIVGNFTEEQVRQIVDQLKNSPQYRPLENPETKERQPSSKVISVPDTDKYRKIIDFDSGESLSITGDYGTEEVVAFAKSYDKPIILYDANKDRGAVGFYMCNISARKSEKQNEIFNVVKFEHKELPILFEIQMSPGKKYYVKVTQADEYKCELEIVSAEKNISLRPGGETEGEQVVASSQKAQGDGPVDIAPEDFKLLYDSKRKTYALVVSIENQGEVSIPKNKIRFHRGNHGIFDEGLDETSNQPSGWYEAGPIEPGKTWNERTRDFSIGDGDYTFTVVLDYDNAISETNEDNNRATLDVTIKDGQVKR